MSKKFGKLWKSARERTGKLDHNLKLVWDGDILMYNAVWDHMREEKVENTDELVWRMDLGNALIDLIDRIRETERDLGAGAGSTICFGGRSNWRNSVLPTYKANRDGKKPLGWYALQDSLGDRFTVWQVPSLEADDLCGILHTGRASCPTIAISEDKDFRQLPGLYYNPRKPHDGVVRISSQEAIHWHMLQALAGDSTDNYKGCPGIGEVNARKLLPHPDREIEDDEEYEAECWKAVVAAYEKKGLDEEDALVQAQVARLLRDGEWDETNKEVELWMPGNAD